MSQKKPLPPLVEFPSYKGGYTLENMGYLFEFAPSHPLRNYWGFVAQHRLVAEDMVGRPLAPNEVVHHKDENPHNNDPANLQIMTRAEHQAHHAQKHRRRAQDRLTVDSVREALRGGSLKKAAATLGVHTQTLRNRFPDLIAPYKRKSPTRIDSPEAIDAVRRYAIDPAVSVHDMPRLAGMSAMTALRICRDIGIQWVKKSRKGEKRRTYRRKNASPSKSAPDA